MTSPQPTQDADAQAHTGSPMAPLTLTVAHSFDEIDRDPAHRARTAYIVVDVIRATTTLVVMFEHGARRVLVARDVDAARAVRATEPEAILAGEVNAVAPPDFDHGNSPQEWSAVDVAGRNILFSTSNGARALHAAMGGGPVFAGSLRNASAVCAAALAAARQRATPEQGGIVTVVCSGLGAQPADDDSLCAGWLIQTLRDEARRDHVATELGPGAQRALDLLAAQRAAYGQGQSEAKGEAKGEGQDADVAPRVWLAAAMRGTPAAQAVLAAGLGADLAWCANVDASTVVPMIAGEDVSRKLVIVERAPERLVGLPIGEEIR